MLHGSQRIVRGRVQCEGALALLITSKGLSALDADTDEQFPSRKTHMQKVSSD